MTYRLRHLVAVSTEKTDVAATTTGRIDLEDVEGSTGRLLSEAGVRQERTGEALAFQPGDVLFGKLRPYLRKSYVADTAGCCSPEFAVLRPDQSRLDLRFLHYLTLSEPFVSWAVATSTGVKMPRTNAEALGEFRADVPDLGAQREVVALLDSETARLDDLAERKQTLLILSLERLRTMRKMLTDGAGPLRPLGWTVRVYRGTTFPHDAQGQPSGVYPFVKVRDFTRRGNESTITDAENWVSDETAVELGATVVPAGAVVVPRVGMAMRSNPRRVLGRACILDDNQLGLLLTVDGEPRFLYHWLGTVDLAAQANPGPVPSITEADLFRLRIPWPHKSVQRKIAAQLDDELERVTTLANDLRRSIELLRERRRSVITHAVERAAIATPSGVAA